MKKMLNFTAKINLSHVATEKWKAERMYNQGYRFVGKHSAIKVCEWTKKGIRGCSQCYKHQFYNISSHQCIQMSPAVFFCDLNCLHCWRSLNFILPKENFVWDKPDFIIEESIKEHIKYLQGFFGRKANAKTMKEAMLPKHFAISLSGEPTLYPYLPELIDKIKSRMMTAFLVTNGAHPEMVEKLLSHQPTNLYVTLAAPNKSIYNKECCPMIKDGWERLQKTISLLKRFSCITVIRLTLSKATNMAHPEQYAKIIEAAQPKFVELKGYMAIGGARAKMGPGAMPAHNEIIGFSKEIEKNSSYRVFDEKSDSRVVIMRN